MKKLLSKYFITLLRFERLCSVMSKFYGVKAGRVPGVYERWADVSKNINGFPHPEFRKFTSRIEALAFVNGDKSVPPTSYNLSSGNPKQCTCVCRCGAFPNAPLSGLKRNIETLNVLEPLPKQLKTQSLPKISSPVIEVASSELGNPVHVYTDGACSGNGKTNSNGGIGVYWGPNHPMNVSEPLFGRQTNNRAEIMAAVKALQQARSMGYSNIILHTDSQFLINGITNWIFKWKKNGWKLVNGSDVINKEDFLALDEAQQGLAVEFKYVKGHGGDAGNVAADELAVQGRQKAR